MMSNKVCDAWRKEPLYYATIEYHRFWLSVDQPRLSLMKQNSGKIETELLKDIAQEYRVKRNFKALDEQTLDNETNASKICDILNSAKPSWQNSSALDRLASCKKIIEEIRKYSSGASTKINAKKTASKKRKKVQNNKEKTINAASAVSKFVWFMKPDGWTIFDKYAADGIGIPQTISINKEGALRPSALDRMECFYTALAYENFFILAAEMQLFIRKNAPTFAKMPAARILDTLFMARGERGAASEHGVKLTKAYLNGLPTPLKEELRGLACALHKQFRNHELLKNDQPKIRGKHWLSQRERKKNGDES
jgi:hypothetical protein